LFFHRDEKSMPNRVRRQQVMLKSRSIQTPYRFWAGWRVANLAHSKAVSLMVISNLRF
jgi:hypothetical protein